MNPKNPVAGPDPDIPLREGDFHVRGPEGVVDGLMQGVTRRRQGFHVPDVTAELEIQAAFPEFEEKALAGGSFSTRGQSWAAFNNSSRTSRVSDP